ncbi:carbohydrate ABC transporter permease [Treponema phagedenis]|nr:carbohydrate ABC transporter permease [Treponema phagedenis]QEJ96433.1 carbohydrate ABC transporter permease [Treponema phagedenis]QEJ99665.1 carbohydrate ABC transporter permease [Treponema phagedenis]QEK02288.1 carbohydrate ABC transporter permease [Treponema phagedenis]QEK05216.1 carbohydrate ABC transporter permease [Treponema phagedenis]
MLKASIVNFFTNKHSNRSVAGSVLLLLFLVLFALLSLFPVLFMINNAFKPINELFIFPPKLFVMQPTLGNFADLFEIFANSLVPLLRYFFNTLFIVLVGSFGYIFLASMAAFPLAKFQFPGNALISKIIVMALMFSPSVTAVPSYVIMAKLGFIDTYWSIIFPAFALPLGLFLMSNFMSQVPNALIDAAKVDGAGYMKMLWTIVMPAVKPAWITLFIISFQGLWGTTGTNYIYKESIKPIAAMLSQIAASGSAIARAGALAAASLLMFIIPVTVFIISQSNVLQTMVTSGIKD